MKMYKYISTNSNGQSEEIWACENCRKKNYIKILKGEWRLIDKCENANFECNNCHTSQTEVESQIFSDTDQKDKTPSV